MTSHEIRNPLSAVIHCADEIVENNKKDPAAHVEETLEAAHMIEYCAQHIRNIVGAVLTLSKLDSKLVEICPVPVQPKEAVTKIIRMFSSETRAADTSLTYREDRRNGDLDTNWLVIDLNRFVQVLINLVTNAIKFTRSRPKRQIHIRLSVCTETPPMQSEGVPYIPSKNRQRVAFPEPFKHDPSVSLVVVIEDTGSGMGAKETEHLFQRFKQANPKTENQYGGSGLGLFICRDLTELQGGGIGVHSEPNVGSKFIFFVEAKQATPPEHESGLGPRDLTSRLRHDLPDLIGISASQPPAISSTTNDVPSSKSRQRNVLIVEDNLINQQVLAKQLRKRGYEVTTACHGEEALELLRSTSAWHDHGTNSAPPSRSFHVVLMDIEMPVMGGIECMKTIRDYESEEKLIGKLPIFAVTANVRDELTDRAMAAGADAIMTKPYRIDELTEQIEQVFDEQKHNDSTIQETDVH